MDNSRVIILRRVLIAVAAVLLVTVAILSIRQRKEHINLREEQITASLKEKPSSDLYKDDLDAGYTEDMQKVTKNILESNSEKAEAHEDSTEEDKIMEAIKKAEKDNVAIKAHETADENTIEPTESEKEKKKKEKEEKEEEKAEIEESTDKRADQPSETEREALPEDTVEYGAGLFIGQDEGDIINEESVNDDGGALHEPSGGTLHQPSGMTGHSICIDAGHQAQGNSEHEAIGPGASETKPKVASGTHGNTSGLDEYELNLQVSLKLRDELKSRGYDVYMIRETNDVNISNKERAELAASSGCDILVRIHANGSDDTSVNGALTMAPGADNPYMEQALIDASYRLSLDVISSFCQACDMNNMGVQRYNNMSGINWSTIPVTIVEMGFMSNPSDDLKMADASYQYQMVKGIADGIDTYFGS